MHLDQNLLELLLLHTVVNQGNQIGGTVIVVVDEHLVLRSGLQNLLSAYVLNAEKAVEQSLLRDLLLSVVNHQSLVVVLRVVSRKVVQFSGEGILLAVGHIVVVEHNDVLGLHTVIQILMVLVGDVRLVTVVRVRVGTADDHSPVISGSQSEKDGKQGKSRNVSHSFTYNRVMYGIDRIS